MHVPATPAEFLSLVDETIFEAEELIACADDEGDVLEFGNRLTEYREIAAALTRLRAGIQSGDYEIANGKDLEFMAVARPHKVMIPFYGLLETLNLAHKKGF